MRAARCVSSRETAIIFAIDEAALSRGRSAAAVSSSAIHRSLSTGYAERVNSRIKQARLIDPLIRRRPDHRGGCRVFVQDLYS